MLPFFKEGKEIWTHLFLLSIIPGKNRKDKPKLIKLLKKGEENRVEG